jgi:hypothetical protein
MARTAELAISFIRQNLAPALGAALHSSFVVSRSASWCIGTLAQTDAIAEILAAKDIVPALSQHFAWLAASPDAKPEDICACLFAVARMSRTIKIAKAMAKGGIPTLIANQLKSSTDSEVLDLAARAAGCLVRPNSSDMVKALLEAGVAQGLARLPSVLPLEEVKPLGSFAFAIQRFSCAEWGAGTRKALVQAGVVDSLLAALRTAGDEPCPEVHIDLALAVSFLADVNGGSVRKEIINAGGIDILRSMAKNGSPQVAKACNMAITSVSGNIWTRNAGSSFIFFTGER